MTRAVTTAVKEVIKIIGVEAIIMETRKTGEENKERRKMVVRLRRGKQKRNRMKMKKRLRNRKEDLTWKERIQMVYKEEGKETESGKQINENKYIKSIKQKL